MTASSLRPIRRASTSSFPAAVSKRHPLASLTSGTGNGQSSLPMTSVFRLGPASARRHCSPTATVNTSRFCASGRGIRRRDQLLTIWSEDGQQLVEVSCLHGFDESLDRVFRRTERALLSSLSRSPARKRGNPDQRAGTCQRKTPTQEPEGVLRSICGAHHDRLSEAPVIDDARRRHRRRRASCCGFAARERWRNVAMPRSSIPRTRPNRRCSVDWPPDFGSPP